MAVLSCLLNGAVDVCFFSGGCCLRMLSILACAIGVHHCSYADDPIRTI